MASDYNNLGKLTCLVCLAIVVLIYACGSDEPSSLPSRCEEELRQEFEALNRRPTNPGRAMTAEETEDRARRVDRLVQKVRSRRCTDVDAGICFEGLQRYVRSQAPCSKLIRTLHGTSCHEDRYAGTQLDEPRKDVQQAVLGILTLAKKYSWRIDLSNVNLRGIRLARKTISRGVKIDKSNLAESHLAKAQVPKASLRYAQIRESHLGGADLAAVDFEGAKLNFVCLDNANLQDADMSFAQVTSSSLVCADLRGSTLYKTYFDGSDLRKANLLRAAIDEMSIVDADLRWAKLGLGRNNLNGNLTKVKGRARLCNDDPWLFEKIGTPGDCSNPDEEPVCENWVSCRD